MDRKRFIRATGALFGSLSMPGIGSAAINDDAVTVLPAYLKKGDKIGITAPAGYITREEIQPAMLQMSEWGYVPVIGDSIDKRDFTFGGTDEQRAMDFQAMLDDPGIKAIMCARGGYGAVRIVDKLKWEKFKAKPKWIIGFSDVTVFHSHLDRNLKIASIHSKMCNSFPDDWAKAEPIQIETILSIRDALNGTVMKYNAPFHSSNKLGTAKGTLIGGNLKMLETLAGTSSDINTTNKILFIEDTGEYMYNIDRMLWNLKRTGKLAKLKGLLVGGFKVKVDEGDEDFGRTLQDIVLEKVKSSEFPVCFDFPVGHQRNNFALKCGSMHKLSVTSEGTTLEEIR